MSAPTRDDLGFLLAKAAQRWNDALAAEFAAAGFPEVRPAYGSVLIPLFEEDGLRMGTLAGRGHLSKQTMTQLVRRLEADGLVERQGDPDDARASRIYLTDRSRAFESVAAAILRRLDERVRKRLGAARARDVKAALAELLTVGLTDEVAAHGTPPSAKRRLAV